MNEVDDITELGSPRGVIQRHAPLIAVEVLVVFSALHALLRGDAMAAVIPAALLLASLPVLVVERWARVQIPTRLQSLYAVLLLAGPYLGSHLGFYAVWTPWDTLVHFYSGFVVALGAVFALGVTGRRYGVSMPSWLTSVLTVAVSGFVALLWEIAEFASDALIGTTAQITNFDTMTDLIAGTASAGIVAAALVLHQRREGFGSLEALAERTLPRHVPEADAPAEDRRRSPVLSEGPTG